MYVIYKKKKLSLFNIWSQNMSSEERNRIVFNGIVESFVDIKNKVSWQGLHHKFVF